MLLFTAKNIIPPLHFFLLLLPQHEGHCNSTNKTEDAEATPDLRNHQGQGLDSSHRKAFVVSATSETQLPSQVASCPCQASARPPPQHRVMHVAFMSKREAGCPQDQIPSYNTYHTCRKHNSQTAALHKQQAARHCRNVSRNIVKNQRCCNFGIPLCLKRISPV